MKLLSNRIILSVVFLSLANVMLHAQPRRSAVRSISLPSATASSIRNGSGGNQTTALTFTQTVIGTTLFDLQSNEGAPRRVVNNSDGTISAAWTYSNESSQSSFTDRGTGYNYYNGTAWGANPTSRIESARTGFTNISVMGGKEYVMAHGSSGGILSSRTKGTGSWTSTSPVGGTSPGQDTWFRMATGGSNNNTIHAIVNSQGSLSLPVLGQSGPITYSRSTNGGASWDILHVQLPGSTSAFYTGFGAENYSIDCSGDTVVVVAGLPMRDVVMWKSINNGTSWTKTIIQAAPVAAYNLSNNYTSLKTDINGDGIGDTVFVCSGDVNVTLDINGLAHVTWSNLKVCDNDVTTGSYYIAEDSYGISYWKEGSGSVTVLNGIVDQNSDGQFSFITNPAYDPYGLLYKKKTLTCQPQIGFDTQNNIFITYSAVCETSDTVTYLAQYRHIYITYSTDGGISWSIPEDLTANNSREGVWPSIAKLNTSYISVVYQRDDVPDIYLGNTSGASFLYTYNTGVINDIVFVRIQNPAINSVVTLSGPAIVCRNGTASYTVNNATGASGFNWSVPPGATILSGQNTSIITVRFGTTTGAVQCVTSFAGGTTVGKTLSISFDNVTVSASVTGGNYCSGGSATLQASGAVTYSWSPSTGLSATTGSSLTASPLSTTIYTVTGTSVYGCTATTTSTVTVRPLPTLVATPASAGICPGGSTTITVTGGTSYAWSPATGLSAVTGASVTASPSVTTTYTVSGTGTNGCIGTSTVTISILPLPVVTASPSATNLCSGSSLTVNAGGASTYVWSPSSGLSASSGSTVTASPNSSSGYTVTGTASNGCTATATFYVTVLPSPSVIASAGTFTLCAGSSTTLTTSGASSYVWSPSTGLSTTIGSSAIATPSSSTVYTVTGSAGNGCTSSTTVSLTVNPLPSVSINTASTSICSGTSALLNATGASSYSWTPTTGLNQSTGSSVTASPLSNITYSVTGTTTAGCTGTSTVSMTVLSRPTVLATGPSAQLCQGVSANLRATGATSYVWSPSIGLSASTGDSVIATPAATTIYTVTGTAANGCTSTASVTVNVTSLNLNPVATLPAICAGDSSTLSATGAVSYVWTPASGLSSTTDSVVSASPSVTTTYTVTGTTSNGCTSASTLTISVSSALTVSASTSSTNVCNGNSVTITANGANSYVWSPATDLNTTSGVSVVSTPTAPIAYTVVGTSTNGCTGSATIALSLFSNPVILASSSSTLFCTGDTTLLSASGANSYSWSPSTGLLSTTGSSVSATPAATTIYTVTGTANSGCTATATVPVNVLQDPSINIMSTSNNFCSGSSSNLTASGAQSYVWSPSAGLTTTAGSSTTASPSVTTAYTVTGTASNGCSATFSVLLSVNPSPIITLTVNRLSFCLGDSSNILATGASSYAWTPSAGLNTTTGLSVTAQPVTSTVYTVTGTAANGCTATTSASLTVRPLPVVSATPSTYSICPGTFSTITASGATSYSWLPFTGLNAITGAVVQANPSSNTIYTVTGTAANGCTATDTAFVAALTSPPVVLNTSINSICAGASTILTASGANTYAWSPSAGLSATTGSDVTASPLVTTTYTVIGTGTNGCTSSSTLTVTVIPNPVVSVSPASASYCEGGSATLSVSGAGSYVWSPALGLNSTTTASVIASPATTTTYTVTGTGTGNCTATSSVTVTVLSKPIVLISPSPANICLGSSSILTASGAVSYSWSPSTALSSTSGASVTASPSSAITYTVTGTAANNCTSIAAVTIGVLSNPTVTASAILSPICSGSSTTLNASGATTYTWTPAAGLSSTSGASVTASPTVSTVYTVVGAFQTGCTGSTTVSVSVNSSPTVNSSATPPTICQGASSTLAATGAASYSWSPSTNLSSTSGSTVVASPSSTSTYTVTGTASNGCTSSSTVSVTISGPPVLTVTGQTSVCPGLSTTLSVSGASTYTWSPSTGLNTTTGSTVTASPSSNITYSVTGTSSIGCVSTTTVSLTIAAPAIAVSAPSYCIQSGDSVTLSASGSISYSWSPATGLSATSGSTIKASPPVTTTYTVIGTSGVNCTTSATITVYVNSFPTAVITNVNPVGLCPAASVTLNSTTSNGTSYQWLLNNTAIPGATSPTYQTTAAGSYSVVITNALACSRTSNAVTVNPLSPPSISASASPDTTVCSGSSVTLNGSGGVSYVWNNNVTNGTPFVITDTTTYTVTGTGSNGCTATNSIRINAVPYPIQPVIIGDSSIVPSVSYTYFVNAQAGVTYSWTITGGTIQSGQGTNAVNVTWNQSGTHLLQVQLINAASCAVSDSLPVTNNNCNLTFSILQYGNTVTCNGDSVYLIAVASTSATLQWYKDGTLISGQNDDSLLVTASGGYQLQVTIGPCDSVSAPVSLQFLPRPVSPTIQLASLNGSCGLQSDTLSVSGAFTAYNWSTGSVGPIAVITDTGSYSVIVTASNGCTTSSTVDRTSPFVLKPLVCLVTVQSSTGFNNVIWERPDIYGIDSFYVYKETLPGVYTKIGAVDALASSIFEDNLSNPSVQSDRYRISAVDSCGLETEPSASHKTIHLSATPGVGQIDLNWDDYEGYSYSYVYILRGISPTLLSVLDSVAYPVSSYTDLGPINGTIYYAVEIRPAAQCQPVTGSSTVYTSSRSNAEPVLYSSLASPLQDEISNLTVYPNPSSGKVYIEFNRHSAGQTILRITDLTGRTVAELLNSAIERGSYIYSWEVDSVAETRSGLYFIHLITNESTLVKRVMIAR